MRIIAKESKATGPRAVVCPPIGHKAMAWLPLAKAIGKATGIKTWPEDDRPREKYLRKYMGEYK